MANGQIHEVASPGCLPLLEYIRAMDKTAATELFLVTLMPTIDELRASTIVTGNNWMDALLSEKGRSNLNWLQPQSDVYVYTFELGRDFALEDSQTSVAQTPLFSAQRNAVETAIDYIAGLTGIKFV